MVEYLDGYAYVDGYKFRQDEKTGYYLCTKAVNGRRPRLHVYIWEKNNGKVPVKYQVHHMDKNKQNNEPENFKLIAIKNHMRFHGNDVTEMQRENRAKMLREKAIPASRAWHGTKEGHDWHSKHGIEVAANIEPQRFECDNCGKEFFAKSTGLNRFCSSNCKSAWRRKSGADNVLKTCDLCGGEYIANKYQKTTRCEVCKHKGFTRSR